MLLILRFFSCPQAQGSSSRILDLEEKVLAGVTSASSETADSATTKDERNMKQADHPTKIKEEKERRRGLRPKKGGASSSKGGNAAPSTKKTKAPSSSVKAPSAKKVKAPTTKSIKAPSAKSAKVRARRHLVEII